ncbi:hypothetical protein IFO70_30420 [Phormidium tenue FACHB-886]|nr:hypothetical protein [Phormidium tenue FACHB-886]
MSRIQILDLNQADYLDTLKSLEQQICGGVGDLDSYLAEYTAGQYNLSIGKTGDRTLHPHLVFTSVEDGSNVAFPLNGGSPISNRYIYY